MTRSLTFLAFLTLNQLQMIKIATKYITRYITTSSHYFLMLGLGPNIKKLTSSVDSLRKDVFNKLSPLNDLNANINSELENINAVIESNKEKLNKLESSDVFRGELNTLKNDMKVSFADIVSRGIKGHTDDIKAEVKTVQATINDAKQIKERENNLIMFHLPESGSDRVDVMKILKHLSNNVVDANLVHLTRLGKKSDDHTRPLLLKMDSVDIKNMIIKNVSKLKSLDVSLGRIGLSHDLSPEQRKELRSKIEEARALKASDKGFLYRVRGQSIGSSSFVGNACGYDDGRGDDIRKYSISNCNVNDFKNYGHISASDRVSGKDGGGSFNIKDVSFNLNKNSNVVGGEDFGVLSLTLGVIGNDYLDSSLDGNKCLMMKGTGNDLNGNVNFGCCNDGHGLDGGGYSMVCGTGSDLNVIGKNGCGKDDGSDCVITNGAGNDCNESGGFNDFKKVGNNNVMKGGAVGRNIGGIKNDRTNNNFCVVKIKLGLLNIRSIGSKYNIIYDLIINDVVLDIFVVTESWHGSSENPSIALSAPPGYRFVDCVREHDPLHGGLIIFFRLCLKCKKIALPTVTTFEVLVVRFTVNSQEFILLAIYRPGSAQLSGLFFRELISILENITVLSSRIVLTGDFNVHVEKTNDPHAANLNEIFDNFQLINRVKAPTHLRGGTLDLIVTSEDFPVHDCLVHPTKDFQWGLGFYKPIASFHMYFQVNNRILSKKNSRVHAYDILRCI
ncbi:hypothetical protein HELRODRAFT_161372 [Helobdella robusta]|uniref:Endonuclease/exonuclease/phosphatase domain-containing protein n=1 Tax=Helobdella robusta TaxID=6412 RepID=T1ERE7_HELRO|nr:hypothetical protein HELRODRAFT_161372 [Helobdella robusta]ESO02136.1 hypothetical protein HELRODRAFT_161372 [Helobdella robusta]